MSRQRDSDEATAETLILASASPRRLELLVAAGQVVDVEPSTVVEERFDGEAPEAMAMRLAREKGLEVAARRPGRWVLAADTVVVIDEEPLGKPQSSGDARSMLLRLSGREHRVLTAFVVVAPSGSLFAERVVTTAVTFRDLGEQEILDYVAGGEPAGKAGAYAIQGGAGSFVRDLRGSYSNVVGLPVDEVREALRRAGCWREASPR